VLPARLWTATGALLLGASTLAQSAPRPEALIKWRQSAFEVIAWNTARIKSALAGKYDRHEVQSAANALASVANAGLPSLFVAGSADGKGWRETTVRDEAFSDAARFRALSDEFARESSTLARLAAGDDAKAVKQQFAKVAGTCKACHDKYRQTD
jgi:cytochrome c556